MPCKDGDWTPFENDAIIFEFLDVGQGDSTLVIMPGGEMALVDFGEKGTPFKVGIDNAKEYLLCTIAQNSKKRGLLVPTLDHLFLTHGDSDHYNKIPILLTADWGAYVPAYKGKSLSITRLTYGGVKANYGKPFNLIDTALKLYVVNPILELADKDHCVIGAAPNFTVAPDWTYGNVKIYLPAQTSQSQGREPTPQELVLMFEYDIGKGNDNPRASSPETPRRMSSGKS